VHRLGSHSRGEHTDSVPRTVCSVCVGFVVAAVAAVGLVACSGGSNAVDQTAGGDFRFVGVTPRGKTIAPDKRKTAGAVTGSYLSGSQRFTLAGLKGQVVVFSYWGSWCGPCVVEIPAFDKIYRQYKTKGVQFVGVDIKDERGSAQSFVTDNNISFPILFDPLAKTSIQLGRVSVQAMPSTVVIDKQGRVAAVYAGSMAAGDLEPVLNQLVAGQ
jgi:peroxiredoxin